MKQIRYAPMADQFELEIWTADERERRDAAANRALILETAEQLFNERGVGRVNMAEIAQAAGVGKGTLYRRFANKGELCLSLLDSQLRSFQDEQLAMFRQARQEHKPFLSQLTDFLRALALFTERHMPLLAEVQQHGRAVGSEVLERPHSWQYITAYGLLREAMLAGELAEDTDAPVVAEALLAPLGAFTFRFQRERLGFTPERIGESLALLVRGLGSLV
jgi:AcrR family transcriptional regulator